MKENKLHAGRTALTSTEGHNEACVVDQGRFRKQLTREQAEWDWDARERTTPHLTGRNAAEEHEPVQAHASHTE